MKLLHITSAYPEYLRELYGRRAGLAEKDHEAQKRAIHLDSFAWADFWAHALNAKGVDTLELLSNCDPLQRAWWSENRPGVPMPADLHEIAAEQAGEFQPDVLWFDESSPELLAKIREKCPSIRLVLGWVGSAMPPLSTFEGIDLVLSCAQESVERLIAHGKKAALLHHGFDPRILERVPRPSAKEHSLIFIGQIIRGSEFHNQRSKFLEDLSQQVDLTIFSSIAGLGAKHEFRTRLRQVKYGLDGARRSLGLMGGPKKTWPVSQQNKKLAPYLQSAKYGLEMYETIAKSKAVLNIHADSSPRYASNMRLFETTGMGSCLLTDWRDNLPELFEVDKEIVVYRNLDECIEKASWLLNNPVDAERIARAGQARTLRDHTFSRRAERFLALVQSGLGNRKI